MTSMRVAFDHQAFSGQAYGGVSRYFCELAEALCRLPAMDVTVVCPVFVNRYLRDVRRVPVQGVYVPRPPNSTRLLRALNAPLVRLVMRRIRPDVVHETYFARSSTAPAKSRIVVTVYDMIHERYPDQFPDSRVVTEAKRAAVERADHVMCISECTRRDLVDLFEVDASKVSVTYLASSIGRTANTDSEKRVEQPYILFVGSRPGYKNFNNFMEAYASSGFLRKEFSVVCFGGGAFSREEERRMEELKLDRSRIRQLGGSDAVLWRLYHDAAVFVCPSLYEGFGLPVLEAMESGCPVVSSSGGSLPEIAGDAAAYFDAGDRSSIAAVLEKVLQDRERLTEMGAASRRRAVRFSWLGCAKETRDIYLQVV